MSEQIIYDNYKINYHIEGSGEPIIFLHGWPTNAKLWQHQVTPFKEKYKVITIDWLGFGKSDKPYSFDYNFSNSKEILDTIIKKLIPEDEKVNIVAHDIGGPPAILWASENQESIKRLILLNTVIYPFSTSLDKLSHIFFQTPLINNIIVSNFGLKLMFKILTKSGNRKINSHLNEIFRQHKSFNKKIKLKTILNPLHKGKGNDLVDLESKFRNLKNDKYLIIAKDDPLCYKHIKKLKDNNPEVPHYIIEKCGHYIPIDKPDELNKILLEIINPEIVMKRVN